MPTRRSATAEDITKLKNFVEFSIIRKEHNLKSYLYGTSLLSLFRRKKAYNFSEWGSNISELQFKLNGGRCTLERSRQLMYTESEESSVRRKPQPFSRQSFGFQTTSRRRGNGLFYRSAGSKVNLCVSFHESHHLRLGGVNASRKRLTWHWNMVMVSSSIWTRTASILPPFFGVPGGVRSMPPGWEWECVSLFPSITVQHSLWRFVQRVPVSTRQHHFD